MLRLLVSCVLISAGLATPVSLAQMPEAMPASVSELPFTLPPSVPDAPRATPATSAGARLLERIDGVLRGQVERRYEHTPHISPSGGVYRWDCSAMVAWMLRHDAPRALHDLGSARPVARDIAAHIQRASTRRSRGLSRIGTIADVRPGDLFAWRRPTDWGPGVTGHSGFVLDAPLAVPGAPNTWLVRIADSTSLPHGSDTRAPNDGGGLGTGVLLFVTDAHGHATHYGWFGLETRYVVRTDIVFARLWG